MALDREYVSHRCCPFLCTCGGHAAAQFKTNVRCINYELWNLTQHEPRMWIKYVSVCCMYAWLWLRTFFNSFILQLPPPHCASWQGCSFHSGWWCGCHELYWQLPMSIRHYGMNQCFTQYLNLIYKAPELPGQPGCCRVGQSRGNKVNITDRMPFCRSWGKVSNTDGTR